MKFAKGFNDTPCTVRIQATDNGVVEVWIEHAVRPPQSEILVYGSLDELLALKKEIDVAVKRMFGIEHGL